jgi:hypothetical protein
MLMAALRVAKKNGAICRSHRLFSFRLVLYFFGAQPFFQAKRISDEIRRMQTIPEQQKWPIYFATWGCVVCGTKTEGHAGCGMRAHCYRRTTTRLKTIVASYARRSDAPNFGIQDDEQIAREAFVGSVKSLPAKTVGQKRRSASRRKSTPAGGD